MSRHRMARPATLPWQLALVATAAATIALPPTAHADPDGSFQSPSGKILCVLTTAINRGAATAACQAQGHTYTPPPAADCHLGGWGSQINLDQGDPPRFRCVGGVLATPPMPTLDYGQSRSAGTITCTSEPSGVRCTDSSTGHFFRLSRESYDLG
jgi:hypothetical protein